MRKVTVDADYLAAKSRQDDDGCRVWTGYKDKCGYGRVVNRDGEVLAHRVAYKVLCGAIPNGMHVLHQCDNPPCINPTHLFLGSHQDNMKDREAKGRTGRTMGRKGTASHASKLKEKDLELILGSEASAGELAKRLSVSTPTIYRVRRGVTYGNHPRVSV
jgi:hypothetical protein